MMKSTRIYLFFFTALILVSCSNHQDIDVSNIHLNLKIERFDQAMANLSPSNITTQAPALQKKYGSFYNDYMQRMLEVGSTSDTAYYKSLRIVLQNKDYLELKSSVASTYPQMDKIETEQQDLPFTIPIHENIRGNEYYQKIMET